MYRLVHSRMVSAMSSAASAYASMLANFLLANAVLTPGGMTLLNWWKNSSEVDSDDTGRISISSIVGVMLGFRIVNEASFLAFCDLVRPNCLMRAALSEVYLFPSVAFSTANSISSATSAGRAERRYAKLVLSSVMAGLRMVNWAST